MEFHKILVPIDFSRCSLEAYKAAAILSMQFGGELLVFHVIDSRMLESLAKLQTVKAESITRIFRKEARLKFRSFLLENPSEAKIRRSIVTGIPFQEIIKTARQEQVNLIVMGRYGGTGEMEKIFFGSTAEKVVRVAPCSVLSILLNDNRLRKETK